MNEWRCHTCNEWIPAPTLERALVQHNKLGHSWAKEPRYNAEALQGLAKFGDTINHPPHYGGANNQYEAIKVIAAWGYMDNFPIGSVLKYICRAPHKGTPLQDLEKAKWYLEYEIARLRRADEDAKSD